jgi:hypothetical protein
MRTERTVSYTLSCTNEPLLCTNILRWYHVLLCAGSRGHFLAVAGCSLFCRLWNYFEPRSCFQGQRSGQQRHRSLPHIAGLGLASTFRYVPCLTEQACDAKTSGLVQMSSAGPLERELLTTECLTQVSSVIREAKRSIHEDSRHRQRSEMLFHSTANLYARSHKGPLPTTRRLPTSNYRRPPTCLGLRLVGCVSYLS